ncbi:portal protein [Mycobacterium phage Guo1]|nr:portal protein [Mycobacterium phage Guo1]
MLGAGPEWLKETEVGLELLGLTPQQVKRALAERRRASSVSIIEALSRRQQEAAQAGEDQDQGAGEPPANEPPAALGRPTLVG